MPQAALGAHQLALNTRMAQLTGVSMPQAALGAHQLVIERIISEVHHFRFNAASGTWRASTCSYKL